MPQRKDSLGGLYCFPEVEALPLPQVVAYTGTAAASAALAATTNAVTLIATSDCWLMIGQGAPVAVAATAGSFFLPAKYPVQFCVNGKLPVNISAVQDTAAGKLSIIEHA